MSERITITITGRAYGPAMSCKLLRFPRLSMWVARRLRVPFYLALWICTWLVGEEGEGNAE